MESHQGFGAIGFGSAARIRSVNCLIGSLPVGVSAPRHREHLCRDVLGNIGAHAPRGVRHEGPGVCVEEFHEPVSVPGSGSTVSTPLQSHEPTDRHMRWKECA